MRILLDTHTFLWMIFGDNRLKESVRRRIEHPETEVLLSVASLWEIAIKVSLGKLDLTILFEKLIEELANKYSFKVLPVSVADLVVVSKLPFHHRDSFDRLLIAHALVENVPIATRDSAFSGYPVQIIW